MKEKPVVTGRLLSLDAFRGLTMFFLVAEGTELYQALQHSYFSGTLLEPIVTQFTHHPWNGLRAWDLVQPFFMFIVGVAMPFAFAKRWEQRESWSEGFKHVVYRSAILFSLGVILHCGYSGKLVWELWNVLTQLSVTYLVAFLMMRQTARTQIGFTFGLLLLTELAYRLFWVPGFDQPFVQDQNFGSYMDLVFMGKLNDGGGWVAINCVPTTAHTMWGVLAGQLLRSSRSEATKLKTLVIAGLIGIVVGYALDPVTPIIKRICTSSFVIVSGGWSLLALAGCYWLIDIKGMKRWCQFAVIFGMNSIFIYMFSNTVGMQWFNHFVAIFTSALFSWSPEAVNGVLTALVVLALEWYLCYWLWKKRIFIKI